MAADQKPRIEPALPADWSDVEIEALSAFPRPLNNALSAWRERQALIPGAHAVGTMARHPHLAKAFLTFNAHVLTTTTLSLRILELVVIRLAWLIKSEYILVQHVAAGKRAGLTDAEIERIQIGPDAQGWDPADADLVRAVDEIHRDSRISDATWSRLSTKLDTAQLLDLIFALGCYWTVSMMTNSCRTPPEAAATPLDPMVRARMLGE